MSAQEMAPIVYTPTVGWVAVNYHRLYRRPRGMYFSCEDVGEMVGAAGGVDALPRGSALAGGDA